jgi:hypothetical protein
MFRIIGIALVVCMVKLLPSLRTFNALTYSLGLAHYTAAILYSRGPVERAWSATGPRTLLLGTLAVSLLAWRHGLPLVLLFAFHHAFNEVYVLDRLSPPERSDRAAPGALARLRAAGVLFNLALFLAVLRRHEDVAFAPPAVWFVATAVTGVFFVWALFAVHRTMTLSTLIDRCGLEMMGLGFLALSFAIEITFLEIVAYHFFTWLMYPLPTLARRGRVRATRFLLLSAGLTLGFLMFSRIGMWRSPSFITWFLVGSYVHIVTSVAVSDAHPAWIRRWFGPRPKSVAG